MIWLVIVYYATHGSGVYKGQPIINLQYEMRQMVEAVSVIMLVVPSLFSLAIMLDTLRNPTTKRMLNYVAAFFVIIVISASVLLAVTTKLLTTQGNVTFILIYCFIVTFIIIDCLRWLLKTL
ncbi:hypothetical protein C5Z26_02890 [Lactobacillus sp. CBA3606]|nr:hypothetical protein C5Z26_02890 [Lactobacillus sp. CBA3606]